MGVCPQCGAENVMEARFCQSCGAPLQPTSATGPLPVNTVLNGRYRILKKIGQGGMAFVYLVEDLQNPERRWVAKEMRDDLLSITERLPAIQSFQREADLLSRLDHPALPRVMDCFSEGGRHYLIMEYLEGETLEERIERRRHRPFREDEVVEWAVQICNVLEYLHGQNPPIIYRDLKPGNLIVDRDGRVRLIDFGIARYFDPSKKTDTLKMGTVGYAPPEQYQGGGQCDARSDIYALGATMYYLLTGRDPQDMPPFSFGQARPREVNPRLSDWIDRVVMTALAYHPDDRFQSASAMRAVLQNPGRFVPEPTKILSARGETETVPYAAYPVHHLPQMKDWYQVALAEAEKEIAPLVMEEKQEARRRQAAWEDLYQAGQRAVRQQEWAAARDILKQLGEEPAGLEKALPLGKAFEEGHLAALFPQRASPPPPYSVAQEWATFSGEASARDEHLGDLFMPPLSYPAMEKTLRRHRLLVLQGPHGIGKCSCALALAWALQEEKKGLGLHLLKGDLPLEEVAGRQNRIVIWCNPFGESTFLPPALADRPDLLEDFLGRDNFLILTTTSPLLDLALARTALGLWPLLAETIVSLSRTDYPEETVADILERHAQMAVYRGLITPYQYELISDPLRRLKLASSFPTMLSVRLFVEYALASLEPHLPWSTESLQSIIAGLHGLHQTFSRYLASLDAGDRLYLNVLLWMEGRPRREVWETYVALTRKLQTLRPGLPAAPAGLLAYGRLFCLRDDFGRPQFRHPAYREVIRQVSADLEGEYFLESLDEIERAIAAAVARKEEGDTVSAQAALLLGEMAFSGWDRVAPLLEKLASQEAGPANQVPGRALAHGVQRYPALLPLAVDLLRRWVGQSDVQLRLSACSAIRQLAILAPDRVLPLVRQLAEDALPAVRRQVVNLAGRMASAYWEESLEILRLLGKDAEEEIREAVAERLAYLARWRHQAVLENLLAWAEDTDGRLHSTVVRTLIRGQKDFSQSELVLLYRRMLSRRDEAETTLVAFLSDPLSETASISAVLTELARDPSEDLLKGLEAILEATAWQRPHLVLEILDKWAHHDDRAIRHTALTLLARLGKAQVQGDKEATGRRTLGSLYAEDWFRILRDLAADPVMGLRAYLVYLSPDLAQVDPERTVALLNFLADDPQPRLRQLAALALAPLADRYAEHIIPVLERLVKDEAVVVREAIIPALSEGIARADVIPALTLLSSLVRDPETCQAAMPAFVSTAVSRVVDATPVLSALSKDTHIVLRTAILEVATKSARMYPSPTATFLGPLAGDPDPTKRRQVAAIARTIAQSDPQAPLDLLMLLAQDTQPEIRGEAFEALIEAGLQAPQPGLHALRKLAHEGRSEVKHAVLRALLPFIPGHPQPVLEITDLLLGDADLWVRQETLTVLQEAGKQEPAATLKRLGRLISDPDERIQAKARDLFFALSKQREPALLPVLQQLAQERSLLVALPALQSLDYFVETHPSRVLEALGPLLGQSRPEVQTAVYSLLAHAARFRLTETVRLLIPWVEGIAPNEKARQLYWKIMHLPEGSPIVTSPKGVIASIAGNPNWSISEARQALTLAEMTSFLRRRMVHRITGRVRLFAL